MLRITARINIYNDEGEIFAVYSSIDEINGSKNINGCIGQYTQIQKPFILGRSRLGSGDCYTKKANYYIGSIVSNNNGDFPQDYVFSINASNLKQLTIVFNKRKNEYPKSITVNGETYYDDDPTWVIRVNPIPNQNTEIIINNWNTPRSPLVITSIYADLSIDIDDSNLLSFERSLYSRDNVSSADFGIRANTGSISFIDKDNEVGDLIRARYVNSQNLLSAYLENTVTGGKTEIAYFSTQQWNYNNSQAVVDISLKDDLEEWQSILIEPIYYVPTVDNPQTAEWIYNKLYEQTPERYQMLTFDELDTETKAILSGMTIKYPTLESENLWGAWDRLCKLCLLQIYKDAKGRTICKYSGGQ